jgi:hypothetical protein
METVTQEQVQQVIDRLMEAHETGKPDGWSILATTEWKEVADMLSTLSGERTRYKDAYENMRAFAEANGLDTVARSGR